MPGRATERNDRAPDGLHAWRARTERIPLCPEDPLQNAGPMVGEGIAPMLVEEEVVVVKQVPVPGADRRASPDDPEKPRTAPGTGRTDPGGKHE